MQHNSKNLNILLKAISKVIKEEREKQGKSIRTFAYEYDLQISLISRLENAKNDIKISSLWAVSDALNIPIAEFFEKIQQKLPDNFSMIDL
ncbi:MAG: helix-turn-helix transcriptional regulator [Oscillospiraceae bacterium]